LGGGLYSGGGDSEEVTRPEDTGELDSIADEDGEIVVMAGIELETTTGVVLNRAVELRL
jgi:hypothetical protein